MSEQQQDFHVVCQTVQPGCLTYTVRVAQQYWSLCPSQSDQLNPDKVIPHAFMTLATINRTEIKNAFEETVKLLDSKTRPSWIIALYLIGTYGYTIFDAFPILWLHVPNPNLIDRVQATIEQLSFNGVAVASQVSPNVLLDLIEHATPTLVIRHPRRQLRELLLDTPTHRSHSLAIDLTTRRTLYCPKVVIDSTPPPPAIRPHTLPLLITAIPKQVHQAPQIRRQLVDTALQLQPELLRCLGTVSKEFDPLDPSFPLRVLALALRSRGLFPERIYDQILKYLDALGTPQSASLVNSDFAILEWVGTYLEYREQYFKDPDIAERPLPDGHILLQQMCYDLQNDSNYEIEVSPKAMSQVLNKYGLINGRARPRMIWNAGKSREKKSVQLTSVSIDRKKLNAILRRI